jgi:hypothetical protein
LSDRLYPDEGIEVRISAAYIFHLSLLPDGHTSLFILPLSLVRSKFLARQIPVRDLVRWLRLLLGFQAILEQTFWPLNFDISDESRYPTISTAASLILL